MNSGKGNIILLTIIAVSTLLVSVAGTTFAYFGATMKGEEGKKTIQVTNGTLVIEHGTNSIVKGANLNPGAVITKSFKVTGVITGSENLNYAANLVVKNNTFSNGALVYTLTSKNTSNNGSIIKATSKPVAIPTGQSTIDLGKGLFAGPTSAGSTHEYVLTITFVNTGADQTADLGKAIDATLQIAQTSK